MRIQFQAYGRVQGVGFRYYTFGHAQALGLAGWVRNEPDGSVFGLVEGDFSFLEAFRSAVAKGPLTARVSRLDWIPTDVGSSLPLPFQIR